jgi:hypothetical protein
MKTLLISLILFCVADATIAQPPVEKLTKALQTDTNENALHKSFIHTDKDIYAPGEKIWYEIDLYNVVTQLSARNKEVVVVLKNESGEVVVDQQELVENGYASGYITVPSWAEYGHMCLMTYHSDSPEINKPSLAAIKPVYINRLDKNTYTIEASTDKNIYDTGDDVTLSLKLHPVTTSTRKERISVTLFDDDIEIFSEKTRIETDETVALEYELPGDLKHGFYFNIKVIGRGNNSRKIPVPTTSDRLHVEFHPEGNTLLSNQQQRIVYRAFNPFGQPVSVEGTIYDQTGHRSGLAKILKNHVGMLSLMPVSQNQYTLTIESEYGKGQKFALPSPLLNGTAIHLYKVKNRQVWLDVLNAGSYVGREYNAVVLSNGKVHLQFDFKAKAKNSFQINTADIPNDIIHVAILSPDARVVSERLIYCGNVADSTQLNIKTNPPVAKTNESFDIEVDLSELLKIYSVVDVDMKVIDKQNVFSNANEKHVHFFSNPLTLYPPDNVLNRYMCNIELLGNSYAYYSIEDILQGKAATSEETQQGISGIVTDKSGKPVAGARVILRHRDENALKTVKSDSQGKFLFRGLNKLPNMGIKAVNDDGNKTYNVELDRSFDQTLSDMLLTRQFNRNTVYGSDTYSYYQQNGQLLHDIGAETKDKRTRTPGIAERMLQSGSSILEVIKTIKPFDIISNQIVFYGSRNSLNFQQGALIVIDGQKVGTSIDALSQISPYDVESINISTKPIDIQRYTGLNSVGVIEIRTHGSGGGKDISEEQDEREFSKAFRYDDFKPDVWKYQTTLLWQPNAKIDNEGKVKANVRTSAVQSDFIVQVNVVLSNGRVITKEKIVEVRDE